MVSLVRVDSPFFGWTIAPLVCRLSALLCFFARRLSLALAISSLMVADDISDWVPIVFAECLREFTEQLAALLVDVSPSAMANLRRSPLS